MSITAVTLAARWCAGWYLGARDRPLQRATTSIDGSVSVVVPARNEAASLPRLLQSLRDQEFAPLEVIVVDDDSSDATAEVAANLGATVLSVSSLEPGWTGKNWACARGAAVARGDLLLFLDADTAAAPGLVAAVVAAHRRHGGLVSVQPFHRMERAYERLSACFNIVASMGIGATNLRDVEVTGAYGPCLAIAADDYERIGGHASIASEVLDDVALARRARAAGLGVQAFAGRDLIEFRMYPDGVGALGRGWTKNFAAGAGTTPIGRLLLIAAWISGLIEAGWWTIAGLITLPFGNSLSIVHVAFSVLFAVQLWFFLRRIGNFGVTAWLHPIFVAAFLLVFVRSLAATLRGEVQWKERAVPTRIRVGR